MEIKCKDLLIREIKKEDANAMFAAMECPQIHSMYNYGFTSFEKVTSYIDVILNEYQAGNPRTFAVALLESNELIGSITLVITKMFSRVEYSYWMNKNYRNRGYATELIKAMNEYCFHTLNLNRVEALTSNPASEAAIIKTGMIYEGTLRQYYGISPNFWDVKVYSMLRDEYEARKSGE